MKLSILDQAPISSNQTAREALNDSMKLAQLGEELGYTRYWIAEHHDLPGLACSAPEVMLSYIGANTSKIRIGSGATLLPFYRPYKVAEVFHMLATLFPDRIDLGIGRAPGGSAEATNALAENYLQKVWAIKDSISDLLHFLENNFPANHEFSKIKASPLPQIPPTPWILGTSKKSSILAAQNGLAYAFGQFMSDENGTEIIGNYLDNFTPRHVGQTPQVIVTVSAVCAETTEKAEEIALSSLIWTLQKQKGEGGNGVPSIEEAVSYRLDDKDYEVLRKTKKNMIIGTPEKVKQQLNEIKSKFHTDEIMIMTIAYSSKDQLRSYQLIAEAILE